MRGAGGGGGWGEGRWREGKSERDCTKHTMACEYLNGHTTESSCKVGDNVRGGPLLT